MLVYSIIGLCVIAFLTQSSADRSAWAGLMVVRSGFEWYQLFSSTLLHGGWLHLIFNMIVLLALGPNVEDKLGHARFLGLYLLGAAAAGFAHILFSQAPAIGASGAIAAVTGAYLVLFPTSRIICFAIWITVVGRIAIPAWWFVGINIAIDLLAGGLGGGTGIAHAAHLGGYALGIGGIMLMLQFRLLAREPQDLFTYFRQKRRKAAIQDAIRQQQARVEDTVGADAEPERTEAERRLAEARSEVARLVQLGELDEASTAYERLTREHEPTDRGAALSMKHQLQLAEHLIRSDRPALALQAFHGFVAAYPRDRQTPSASLMMGLLLARRLGRPAEARPHLEWARPRLLGDEQQLADALLAETRPDHGSPAPEHTENRAGSARTEST
ncbi:MAG: rhomboid family intramembrane serine protease [Planctomycetota bacterium]